MTADIKLDEQAGLYYGGRWQAPVTPATLDVFSPSTGEQLATVNRASAADVPLATAAARSGFKAWRAIVPLERARLLRELARIVRANAQELAMLDALDCGNPVSALTGDVWATAFCFDYFAGLVTEMKGSSVPIGPDAVNFSVREPYGVVARIGAFNHPLLFAAGKAAAALAAGNAVIIKPAEQAPLSALRIMDLFEGVLPAGVLNVLTGDREVGAALIADQDVAMVGLIGSAVTGKAVMRGAADGLKRVLLELGGKNALIAFPDSDPNTVAEAAIAGMNFAWCGQSCGSTSRLFLHANIHDAVIARLPEHAARFKPGVVTDPATNMGSMIDRASADRVLEHIAEARRAGATLIHGGGAPEDAALAGGCYVEPTILANVTPEMRIAREEIFGPVLSVLRWSEEGEMLHEVNALPYGLTCSIYTRDLATAHRAAARVEAGYIWINDTTRHVPGAAFGGYKQSGIGREECLEELLSYTQEKTIIMNLQG